MDGKKPRLVEDLGLIKKGTQRRRYGVYECPQCQAHFEALTGNVKAGTTKSCGCWNVEKARVFNRKHGGSYTRLYKNWANMKARSHLSTSDPRYGYYENVSVCDEWLNFAAFREWALSHGYEDHLVLDRVDPRQGYSPDNCEWVTKSENCRRATKTRKQNKAINKQGVA